MKLIDNRITMSKQPTKVELTGDLQAFAEECVRTGHNKDVAEVVFDALNEKRQVMLIKAIDEGIAELDAGLGDESTPDEFMKDMCRDLGLTT